MVDKKRHIAKTISYRLVSSLIGFGLVYVISGSFTVGTTFSIAELLYKPLQYYVHERIWYRWIAYGLNENKSS